MSITLASAIEQFLYSRTAKGYSSNTLQSYIHTFKLFTERVPGHTPIEAIHTGNIERFLISLGNVSNKTRLNHHSNLSALWTWLQTRQHTSQHIVQLVDAPVSERKEILPFTLADITALLETSLTSQYPIRNRAILLLLLDTGLRASEAASLQVRQLDFLNKRITVMGKGKHERTVKFSPPTADALRKLIKACNAKPNSPLLINCNDDPINRNGLANILENLGRRAQIHPCNPHRFRHTFAIQYLRNGGNIYTLQKLLGHNTLDMVKRYLAISLNDIEQDHARASPVKKWEL